VHCWPLFSARQLPKRGVRVSYYYGFSAPIGGGEYPRVLAGRLTLPPGQAHVPIVVLIHGAEHSSALEDYSLQRQFDDVLFMS